MSRSRSVRGAKLLAAVLAGASHPADIATPILRGPRATGPRR
jgi:hypothetical protein